MTWPRDVSCFSYAARPGSKFDRVGHIPALVVMPFATAQGQMVLAKIEIRLTSLFRYPRFIHFSAAKSLAGKGIEANYQQVIWVLLLYIVVFNTESKTKPLEC